MRFMCWFELYSIVETRVGTKVYGYWLAGQEMDDLRFSAAHILSILFYILSITYG